MFHSNRTVVWLVLLTGVLFVLNLLSVSGSRAQPVAQHTFGTIPQQTVVLYFPLIARSRPSPNIREPKVDQQVVNPADVHMEAVEVSDIDLADDIHTCSEWEIWGATAEDRVWSSGCVNNTLKTHIHLGDGQFSGSHVGFKQLRFATEYRLHMRMRYGESEDASTLTPWAQRTFRTSESISTLPLVLQAVAANPQPLWIEGSGPLLSLATQSGTVVLRLESGTGEPLFSKQIGAESAVTLAQELTSTSPMRVSMYSLGTNTPIQLSASQFRFSDNRGSPQVIYFPPVTLQPASPLLFWVSATGDTYWGSTEQNVPDFTTLAQAAPTPWLVEQPGYKVSTFASGFQLPVNIAFAVNLGNNPSDPFFYVTELYGTVKVVLRDGSVHDYANNLLNYNPFGGFPGAGEMGLTGIVVEPITGDLFVSLVYQSVPNGHFYAKVLRLHSDNGGRTMTSQSVVLDLAGNVMAAAHQISTLTIGPDRMLYVHVGDAEQPDSVQDLNSAHGKILRVHLDGSPPADNPFHHNDARGYRNYVYALGFRNPFGGAWHLDSLSYYEVENGPAIDRLAKVFSSGNFGWSGEQDQMYTHATYNWDPAVSPVNIAFVQNQTFARSGFPSEKQGHAFVTLAGATWASGPQQHSKRIEEFVINSQGEYISGPHPFIRYNGSGKATVIALAAGPDGLYFSDFYKDQDYESPIERGSKIWRIEYVGTVSTE